MIVIMKHLILCLALFVSLNNLRDDYISAHKAYMISSYGLTDQQFLSYQNCLDDMCNKYENLKNRRISSAEFKSCYNVLYTHFQNAVSKIFTKEQYKSWKECIQTIERLRILGEEQFVQRDTVRMLYKLEAKWQKERKELWSSTIDEADKHTRNKELLNTHNHNIRKLLGLRIGTWYIYEKDIYLNTLNNMDKFSASYNEANKIARIEHYYHTKRQEIQRSHKKRTIIEEELFIADKDEDDEICTQLPSDISSNWQAINSKALEFTMQNKYGLNDSQIITFINAYKEYTIAEYIIFSSSKLQPQIKKEQITILSSTFCHEVKILFSESMYSKWEGWWRYCIQEKLQRKGL